MQRPIKFPFSALVIPKKQAAWWNERLKATIPSFVDRYGDRLSDGISKTVEDWDARQTSDRIELHIGKDLQFIRINGTIVGGLVGLTIYIASHVFF